MLVGEETDHGRHDDARPIGVVEPNHIDFDRVATLNIRSPNHRERRLEDPIPAASETFSGETLLMGDYY